MANEGTPDLDFLHADLAAVNDMLGRTSEEDVMARMGLEGRCRELKAQILAAEREGERTTASVSLFFGGRPVAGTLGIDSRFATAAVAMFQELVAKVFAHGSDAISPRGTKSMKESSTLFITRLTRGSVGFVLEEMRPRANPTDSALTEAVNEATELMESIGGSDEGRFQESLEATDQRVMGTAGKLFGLLHRNEATLRLVTGNSDRTFGVRAVARAAGRSKSTTTGTEKRSIPGRLAGLLPDARQFEFRRSDNDKVITGKIAGSIDAHTLAHAAEQWLNVDMKVEVEVRRVYRNDDLVRESYTLLALTPSSDRRERTGA